MALEILGLVAVLLVSGVDMDICKMLLSLHSKPEGHDWVKIWVQV